MNKANIPNDKHEATINMNAQKDALLGLLAVICEHDYKKVSDVTELINKMVEEIDKELEA